MCAFRPSPPLLICVHALVVWGSLSASNNHLFVNHNTIVKGGLVQLTTVLQVLYISVALIHSLTVSPTPNFTPIPAHSLLTVCAHVYYVLTQILQKRKPHVNHFPARWPPLATVPRCCLLLPLIIAAGAINLPNVSDVLVVRSREPCSFCLPGDVGHCHNRSVFSEPPSSEYDVTDRDDRLCQTGPEAASTYRPARLWAHQLLHSKPFPNLPTHWEDKDTSSNTTGASDEDSNPSASADNKKGCLLIQVSTATEVILKGAFSEPVPNPTRRRWRKKFGMPTTDTTKCPKLDLMLRTQVPKDRRDADWSLSRLQNLYWTPWGHLRKSWSYNKEVGSPQREQQR